LFSNIYCCSTIDFISIYKILNTGRDTQTIIISTDVHTAKMFSNGIKVDENGNIFMLDLNYEILIKFNSHTNKIFKYGGDTYCINGFTDSFGYCDLASISCIEGALYLMNRAGFIKRIQGITAKKKLISKIESDYQTLATTTILLHQTISVIISGSSFNLHTPIFTCRAPSLEALSIYNYNQHIYSEITQPKCKR